MDQPKYMRIKNRIQDQIINGNYSIGSKIPSEIELLEEFDVSRHTIRRAISELVNDGFLISKQGSGTFVSDDYQHINLSRTKTIGVITTYVSDYIFPSIIRGIEEEINPSQYSLMLSTTQNNVVNEKESLKKMLNQNVDGLIVEPTKSNWLNPNLSYYLDMMQRKIPLLMLHAKYDELDAPVIAMDDEKAGHISTQHLIDLGHEKIAVLTKTDDAQGKKRLRGYINTLTESGLSFDPEYILPYETETFGENPAQIRKLLEKDASKLPTAFVCYNDQVAIQLIQILQTLGYSVPDDFSVVSHDDSYLSGTLPSLRLTSVIHPKEEMGRKAARWMLDAIEKKQFTNEPIIFPPTLQIGNSTKSLLKEEMPNKEKIIDA